MAYAQSGFAALDNTELYFERAGKEITTRTACNEGAIRKGESNRNPLILLHGLGLNLSMWDDQFSEFAKRYHVIRYDLRGFGQSLPPSPAPFSHVDDLKNLLDYFNIKQAHIIGLSLGGRIAIDFALTYPHALNRLVLIDPALGGYRFDDAWYTRMNTILQHGKAGEIGRAKRLWLDHPLFKPVRHEHSAAKQHFEEIAAADAGWHWLIKAWNRPSPHPPPSGYMALPLKPSS